MASDIISLSLVCVQRVYINTRIGGWGGGGGWRLGAVSCVYGDGEVTNLSDGSHNQSNSDLAMLNLFTIGGVYSELLWF